jgi:hypothetical protein
MIKLVNADATEFRGWEKICNMCKSKYVLNRIVHEFLFLYRPSSGGEDDLATP